MFNIIKLWTRSHECLRLQPPRSSSL